MSEFDIIIRAANGQMHRHTPEEVGVTVENFLDRVKSGTIVWIADDQGIYVNVSLASQIWQVETGAPPYGHLE